MVESTQGSQGPGYSSPHPSKWGSGVLLGLRGGKLVEGSVRAEEGRSDLHLLQLLLLEKRLQEPEAGASSHESPGKRGRRRDQRQSGGNDGSESMERHVQSKLEKAGVTDGHRLILRSSSSPRCPVKPCGVDEGLGGFHKLPQGPETHLPTLEVGAGDVTGEDGHERH